MINATSQLGRECLAHLVRARWSVIAGVRSLTDAATLTATYGSCLYPVGLDLDDPRSVELTLEEIGRIAGEERLAVVHVSDPAPLARLESVFPCASGHGRQHGGRAQATLAALLDRADRLVIVSPQRARRAPDATLAGAFGVQRDRRRAGGASEIARAWVRQAGDRGAQAGIGEQLEAALRRPHVAQSPLGG